MHIIPKLDVGFAPLNWRRVSLSEDNSVFTMTQFILPGVGQKPAPDNLHHVIYSMKPALLRAETRFSITRTRRLMLRSFSATIRLSFFVR